MLVYSTTILLQGPRAPTDILSLTADWLSSKTHTKLSRLQLDGCDTRRMKDGSSIETVACVSDYSHLYAVRYCHRDSQVKGRQWVTEIGLRERSRGGETEFTMLLETSEISPLVPPLKLTTRPKLIPDIVKKLPVSPTTPGLKLRHVDTDCVENFAEEVHDMGRRQPIVLVSPALTGGYLVDPESLRDQLVTLADVVLIPPGADTFEMAEQLGEAYCAWRGAINIIFPVVSRQGTPVVYTRRFLATELAEVSAVGHIESKLLSEITHRTNLPNKWRHISPHFVQEERLRADLAKRKQEALQGGKQQEYISILEQCLKEAEKKGGDLRNELHESQKLAAAAESEAGTLKSNNQSLKAALQSKESAESESKGSQLDQESRDAVANCLRGNSSPERALAAIAALFPERIVVLPSAVAASRKSEKFREVDKLVGMLIKLSSDYWQILKDGKGDGDARKIFGKSYSARESETVEANKRAQELRTFVYRGKPIRMMKHLKIGVKESAAETIRVHFEWLPGEKRIVVGYCGPHPDHK